LLSLEKITLARPFLLTVFVRVQYSEQILLDIPHVDGVMFNIKFTYLKMADVT